jgi:chloramphenicol-sensitive protein RarD
MNVGLAWALVAFGIWGFFPLYYRALSELSPLAMLMHRVVWSVVFLALVLTWRRQWQWLTPLGRNLLPGWVQAYRQRQEVDRASWRLLGTFAASALLIATNWLIYVWAVHEHHVVEASLGYFLNPLLNVALGVLVLRERPSVWQWLAIGLAAIGVSWLTWQTGRMPWIALALGGTFAVYGLLRKTSSLGPLEGLTLETLMLAPVAVFMLAVNTAPVNPDVTGTFWWPQSVWTWFLMLLSGPVTAVPLVAFAAAARRLPLATLGLVQYMTPTLQLLQGVWLFGEAFSPQRAVGFGFIWSGLLLVSVQALWQVRRGQRVIT